MTATARTPRRAGAEWGIRGPRAAPAGGPGAKPPSRNEAAMKHAIILAAGILMATLPALGHHSDAGLDMNSVVTVEGVVTEFSMRNPPQLLHRRDRQRCR